MKSFLILTLMVLSSAYLFQVSINADFDQINAAKAEVTPTPNEPNIQCDCTELRIACGFTVVKAGSTVEFRIDTDDSKLLNQPFNWTVSAGTIVSGQGTSKILVQTTEAMLARPSAPTSSPEPSGFFISGRRQMPLTVAAKLSRSGSCTCRPAKTTVYVGNYQAKYNYPANVEELRLDKTEVTLPCPAGTLSRGGMSTDEPILNVGVLAKDPEDDVLTYNFTVSEGKILGTGANVKWDLTDVVPGLYTITAGADDGCGICGKTKTEQIIVKSSRDCIGPNYSCPDLSLQGPEKIDGPGEYTVTANISGASSNTPVSYSWTINNGLIISGQGTPSIQVKIPHDPKGADPLVTLEVRGASDPRAMCQNKVSITLPFKPE